MNPTRTGRTHFLLGAAAGAVTAALVAILVVMATTSTTTTSPPTTTTPHFGTALCSPLPAAAINALAPGSTWDGSGLCYSTPGFRETTSVNLVNATITDALLGKPGKPVLGFPPVVELWGTHNVTLSNLTITGANPTGAYHPKLVGEAGIKLVETSGTTITGTSVSATFGDCYQMWANPPHYVTPNTGVTMTTDTAANCGRSDLTPSDVNGLTVNGLIVSGHSGLDSVDFESDLALGAGNVNISNSILGGIILEESITGPITFTDDTTARVIAYGTKVNANPVTFQEGTLNIPFRSNPAGIWITGGRHISFDQMAFTRGTGAAKAPLWHVSPTGQLKITNSALSGPLGAQGANVVLSGNTGP